MVLLFGAVVGIFLLAFALALYVGARAGPKVFDRDHINLNLSKEQTAAGNDNTIGGARPGWKSRWFAEVDAVMGAKARTHSGTSLSAGGLAA